MKKKRRKTQSGNYRDRIVKISDGEQRVVSVMNHSDQTRTDTAAAARRPQCVGLHREATGVTKPYLGCLKTEFKTIELKISKL